MNYKLKRIGIHALADLVPIFESAFGTSPDMTYISNKHATDFAGVRDIGYVAYSDKDQPAAFYGVFPLEVRINGEFLLVAQSGDTMVAKEHERRGLFILLANETYKLCKSTRIAGVFGFPSSSSYPGFVKKLGWEHLENIKRYQFLIPTIPFAEISARFSIFRKPLVRWQCFLAKLFFPEGTPFEGGILGENQDGIRRNDGYWKYKLNSKSVKLIRVNDCDVVVKFDGNLGIGDVNHRTLEDLKKVISRLKILCFFGGINRIVFYTSPETKLDHDLSKIANAQKGLPIGFLSFEEERNLNKLKFCYLDMDTY